MNDEKIRGKRAELAVVFGFCEPGTTSGGEAADEYDKTETEWQEKTVKTFLTN